MLVNFRAGGMALVALLAVVLAACTPVRQVVSVKDSAPIHQIDPATIMDAIPREDAITRAGNKNPYTVFGKTYYLLPTSEGYQQEGIASWYGTKFQGRPTANGEPYNLYGMTAAHRTLPIPSYVRVTNLVNNRTAVVRVNDRGPFHDDRIIDLSYAAALKLGYADKGTTPVLVETIAPGTYVTRDAGVTTTTAVKITEQASVEVNSGVKMVSETPVLQTQAAASDRFTLQVAAFKSAGLANQLKADLTRAVNEDVVVKAGEPGGYYRVHIGPFNSLEQAEQVSARLLELNYQKPSLIRQ